MSRNVLAVGAFERDNFGDYLFLEALKYALPQDNIIPSSIIYSDMTSVFGVTVIPYDFALKNFRFDVIWVVGGEIGAVGTQGALRMSLSKPLRDRYEHLLANNDLQEQRLLEQSLGANRDNPQAYIPYLRNYPLNIDTPLVVNSAGLSFANKNSDIRSVLNHAVFVGVREKKSLKWCKERSIDARLAPDSVHSLGAYYKPAKIKSGIVFQANEEFLNKTGIKAVAQKLKEIYIPSDGGVTIVAAGTAHMHDNPAQLRLLAKTLTGLGVSSTYDDTRNPLRIIDIIAGSEFVISTSLHMRIIAATFGVKRISLSNEKVANYAKTWDIDLPYDVELNQLGVATRKTRKVSKRQLSSKSKALINDSRKNMMQIKRTLKTNNYTSKPLSASHIKDSYLKTVKAPGSERSNRRRSIVLKALKFGRFSMASTEFKKKRKARGK